MKQYNKIYSQNSWGVRLITPRLTPTSQRSFLQIQTFILSTTGWWMLNK